jgi:cytochrome c553
MRRRTIAGIPLLLAAAVLCGATVASVSAFSATATGQRIRSTPERLVQMQHHFNQVSLIHESVIRGDLPAVREPALQLADSEPPRDVPDSTAPYLASMRLGAKSAAAARELASAAAATASILLACGDCHRSAGTMPVPMTPTRPPVGGLVGHMLEHQRAADEMLEGLFIPSETQWLRGANRFVATPLRQQSLPRDPKLTPGIRQAEKRVHQLAERAIQARAWSDRGEIYAEMLMTCASCHSLHGVVWGPRRSSPR